MSKSTVRIGFIGTGDIAQAHIRSLRDVPEAEIVALCDVDHARVRRIAEPLGATVYTDGLRLIAREQLDALYICVPPYAHGDFEIEAARKGHHLFVEKPVNLYLGRALEVSRAITAAGIMTQVGYGLRYLPAIVRLRAFLSDKEVGTAHVFRWKGLPESRWWRRYDQSGGQFVEMTTHQIDVLRWVMAEVAAVSASYSCRLQRRASEVTTPDSQAALLEFQSGASATVSSTCAVAQGGLGGMEFAVRGARVSVRSNTIEVHPAGSYALPPAPPEGPGITETFIQAVAAGDRSALKSPYADALRTLAVTLAANRSAAEGGRRVRLEELLPDHQI